MACLAFTITTNLAAADDAMLSNQTVVFVESFRFEGNTVFAADALQEVVADYAGRELTSEDLIEARDKLTEHYVNAGYINSGTVLPDQTVDQGVVTLRVIEGRVADLRITGHKHVDRGFLEDRIKLGVGPPLKLADLRDRLELVRQYPMIDRINAELGPGTAQGNGVLDVQVTEADLFTAELRFSNRSAPSIGAERLDLRLSHLNVTGRGDTFDVLYGITSGGFDNIQFAGTDEIAVRYSIPVTVHDTTLTLSYSRSDDSVVEETFDVLDINTESEDYGISLRHPFYRTPNTEFVLYLSGVRRRNKSFLDGHGFSFSLGPDDGRSVVTVLRFGQEFVTRNADTALVARSTFSVGIDALDATTGAEPDGQYLAWLGQFQCTRRLGKTNNLLVARVSAQVAEDALLPMEQFSVGGVDTVRGYRENQIVRDSGIAASIELHVPLWHEATGRDILVLTPFYDIGYAQDHGSRRNLADKHIDSAGIGVHFDPVEQISCRLYWGLAFRNFDQEEHDLQDSGIHFSVAFACLDRGGNQRGD